MQVEQFQPVRTVVHRKGSFKRVGYFSSKKVGRPISFESLLERDFIYLLEFDQNVLTYCEQPFSIRYFEINREKSYVPDFAVQRLERVEIIEVKPTKELQKTKIVKKLLAGQEYCDIVGYKFRIVTEEQINSVVLKNIKLLYGYSNLKVPAAIKMTAREITGHSNVIDLNKLVSEIDKRCTDAQNSKAYIYNLIYHHELRINLAQPISLTSKIWL